MFKKAILISLIMALCVNSSIFAQQTREEKLKEIEMQIAKYTKQRNIGIGLTIGGAAIDCVGLIVIMIAIDSDPYTTGIPTWNYVSMPIGALATGIGIALWQSGAKAVREWELKKIDVAFEAQGPGLTKGNKFGQIALVFRY